MSLPDARRRVAVRDRGQKHNARKTEMTAPDNDMSPAKRAGDKRRLLTAMLHYHEGDDVGVGAAMHEANVCGRGHHFIKFAIETLAAPLKDHPEQVDVFRQEIARLTAIENGDDIEGNE
jgi:hypothetical protein